MTLVVVDMQPEFESSYDCLHGVTDAIRYAINRREAVLLLEYEGSGPTFKEITRLLKNYPKCAVVEKDNDDGGAEAFAGLKEINADLTDIKVCGVNACYCVASTAETLAKLLPYSNIYAFSTEVSCCCWAGEEINDCMQVLNAKIRKGKREGKNDS